MAKKVGLINMKGGVGKSTLAVNLAWQFAAMRRWNKRVLVVDLDPQFNASQYLLGVDGYERIHNAGPSGHNGPSPQNHYPNSYQEADEGSNRVCLPKEP